MTGPLRAFLGTQASVAPFSLSSLRVEASTGKCPLSSRWPTLGGSRIGHLTLARIALSCAFLPPHQTVATQSLR